jgi:hypothetical protein
VQTHNKPSRAPNWIRTRCPSVGAAKDCEHLTLRDFSHQHSAQHYKFQTDFLSAFRLLLNFYSDCVVGVKKKPLFDAGLMPVSSSIPFEPQVFELYQ